MNEKNEHEKLNEKINKTKIVMQIMELKKEKRKQGNFTSLITTNILIERMDKKEWC